MDGSSIRSGLLACVDTRWTFGRGSQVRVLGLEFLNAAIEFRDRRIHVGGVELLRNMLRTVDVSRVKHEQNSLQRMRVIALRHQAAPSNPHRPRPLAPGPIASRAGALHSPSGTVTRDRFRPGCRS
jgi:hypothetical protein